MLKNRLLKITELIIDKVDLETEIKLGEFLFIQKEEGTKIIEQFVNSKKIPVGSLAPLMYWDCLSSDRNLLEYLNDMELSTVDQDRVELYLYLMKFIQRLSLINQMYLMPIVNDKNINFDKLTIDNIGEHFVAYAIDVLDELIKGFDKLKKVGDFFKVLFNDKHDINWIKVFAFSGSMNVCEFFNLINKAMLSYNSLEDLYNQKTYEELECYLSPNHCALAFALMRLKYKDDIYIVMS